MRPHSPGRRPDLERGVRLRDLGPGNEAVIMGYNQTHQSYRAKLLALGLTKGTRIVVRNIAPLGDPVHISVRDFEVTLRRDEADALVLERIGVRAVPGEPGARRRLRAGRLGRRGRHARRMNHQARFSEGAKDE